MRFNQFESWATLALIFLLTGLIASDVQAPQNSNLIRGLVQNNSSQPIPSVSVILRNTKTNFTLGTSTDSSGAFSFSKIPPGGPYSFTFSTVGFETQTLFGYNVKDDITLSVIVKMESTMAALDQVVVVGYGTQRRKDLTGSVSRNPSNYL